MKKLLMYLGGAFLIIVVIVVTSIAILTYKGNTLDKESKQYVDAVIPAIVSTWNKQALIERASPEFKKAVTDDDLDKLISMFRKLGKLKAYKSCEGQANISVTSQQGKVISAAYVAKAEFESGPADIQITLIKHGDTWQILGLHINSKAFLQEL